MKDQLWIELYRENKTICELIENRSQQYGINHVQLYILILSLENKMTVSSLASKLNISKSAVSQALVGLVLKRFVTKIYEEDSKKVFYIGLTKKGKVVTNNLMNEYLKMHEIIIKKMGQDNLSILVEMLEKFNDTIKEIIICREDLC